MATVQSTSIFATAPDGAKSPDSITAGNNSIWVEYGNGAKSNGSGGSSTIVQYDLLGTGQRRFKDAGHAASDHRQRLSSAFNRHWA